MATLKQPSLPHGNRLASLDVFRGIAVAGMIIVNNPGTWRHMYPFLRHAGWTGCNFADLVFPFFLFIVGSAAAFSLPDYSGELRRMPQRIFFRIARRSILLFSLGILLNIFPKILLWLVYAVPPDFSSVRITGVLQRISITYCFLAFAVFYLPRSILNMLSVLLLLLYWTALALVPVPGYGPGTMTPGINLAFFIDRLILSPAHMLGSQHVDPEGIFTTLPAFVTVYIGYAAGKFLLTHPRTSSVSLRLALAGIAALVAGNLWGIILPVCKDLWTSSFVLVSGGWSLLCLAVCHELIDVRGVPALGLPFKVMGMNALTLFVASGFVARILLNIRIVNFPQTVNLWSAAHNILFVPLFDSANAASFAFSLTYLFFWWLILYGMYRRGVFIKI